MKEVNRLATLAADVQGRVMRWKAGTRVHVTHQHGCWFAIEKLHHRKNALPLEYQMAGVPRKALIFDEVSGIRSESR